MVKGRQALLTVAFMVSFGSRRWSRPSPKHERAERFERCAISVAGTLSGTMAGHGRAVAAHWTGQHALNGAERRCPRSAMTWAQNRYTPFGIL